MTLQDWLSNGWLKRHTTSQQEISELLAKVERDKAEASKEEITLDWRLAIAYNACLGCATIALRASGYMRAHRRLQGFTVAQAQQLFCRGMHVLTSPSSVPRLARSCSCARDSRDFEKLTLLPINRAISSWL